MHRKYEMIIIVQKLNYFRKTTALTLLLPMIFDCIEVKKNESDEVWRWVNRKFVMIRIKRKLHSIQKNNCYYLAIINDAWWNKCKNEWDWWSLKASISEICYDSNQTRITLNQNNNCSYLDVNDYCRWKWCKNEQ